MISSVDVAIFGIVSEGEEHIFGSLPEVEDNFDGETKTTTTNKLKVVMRTMT